MTKLERFLSLSANQWCGCVTGCWCCSAVGGENPGGDERQPTVIELEELGELDQPGIILLLPLSHLYEHCFFPSFYNLESIRKRFPI